MEYQNSLLALCDAPGLVPAASQVLTPTGFLQSTPYPTGIILATCKDKFHKVIFLYFIPCLFYELSLSGSSLIIDVPNALDSQRPALKALRPLGSGTFLSGNLCLFVGWLVG